MLASFHSYEEGAQKPYVTELDSVIPGLADGVLQQTRGIDVVLNARQVQLDAEVARDPAPRRWPWSKRQAKGPAKDMRLDNRPPPGWKAVAFVNDTRSDTQLWLYSPEDGSKKIIVAFRGTSVGKDFNTDMNFKHKPLKDLGSDQGTAEMFVHTGFHDAYADSVGDNGLLQNAIDMIIAKHSTKPDKIASEEVQLKVDATANGKAAADAQAGDSGSKGWQVLICGHSLGGALATCATYELAKLQERRRAQKTEGQPLYDIHMYTYGAPRVGNKAFAHAFDQLVQRGLIAEAWRFASPNDLVPTVPTVFLGFCHCGTLCHVYKEKVHIMPDEKAYRVLRYFYNLWTFGRALVLGCFGWHITTWHSIYKKYLNMPFVFVDKR